MSKQSLLNHLEQGLRAGGMVRGTRAVVAVSGGVDSMVLLDALVRLQSRLGLRLHVVHVHHGLRGKAADQDAGFVVAEAVRRGVGVSVARLEPAERSRGISVQVWARHARYASLEAVRHRVKAAWILTAHTLDDQAETVLLNLLRGTGPRGLAGIPASRDRILRPLLGVSRAEVETYAAARQVVFREDASNASDTYRRNRIRHHLLPLLAKEYNPRIARSLAALASLVREDEAALAAMAGALLAAGARTVGRGVRLDIARFGSAPPAVARRALQEAFHLASQEAHGLTRRHLEALLGLLTRDAAVQLPGGLVATRTGDAVEIVPRPVSDGVRSRRAASAWNAFPEVSVRPGRWVRWDPLGCRVRVRRVTASAVPSASRGGRQEILSPAVLAGCLSLRAWQPGDRFRPLGLRGQKKLQDFFVDAKVPRGQRARIPLLLADGRIAWVVGQRVAEDFRWAGRGTACLAEVEFQEDADAVPDRPDPHQRD
ncbi:MAG TPA: tRNA lysidine(34) synthetase TilS [Candidatus Methylomirabilis sp.]|nr:tRNA lysidine(34) synthetase TilS [Candidatus Methylomirabilis sp.]